MSNDILVGSKDERVWAFILKSLLGTKFVFVRGVVWSFAKYNILVLATVMMYVRNCRNWTIQMQFGVTSTQTANLQMKANVAFKQG